MDLLDAYGRPVNPGDAVILPGLVSPVLVVADIRPDLSPRQGPPTLLVTLTFQQRLTVAANRPLGQMLLVVPRPPEAAATDANGDGPRLVE